ncbi:2'-5' RNA ligase family protein [Bacillus sp. BGMRC 2118]|nr:2'-5' RNA ligase family protein [Bacillus sp. BGMRC 2118]
MYAIIALFDQATEQNIQQVWKELKEESISSYAYEVINRRPHITLASYEKLNENEFIDLMDQYYKDKRATNITISSIGSFLNSGTLYYSPTVTNELMELHLGHHTYFQPFNDNPDSLYLPGKWIPHCTIANRLTTEKLVEAYVYCLKRSVSIHGSIKEIALIKIIDHANSPTVHSVLLK